MAGQCGHLLHAHRVGQCQLVGAVQPDRAQRDAHDRGRAFHEPDLVLAEGVLLEALGGEGRHHPVVLEDRHPDHLDRHPGILGARPAGAWPARLLGHVPGEGLSGLLEAPELDCALDRLGI